MRGETTNLGDHWWSPHALQRQLCAMDEYVFPTFTEYTQAVCALV